MNNGPFIDDLSKKKKVMFHRHVKLPEGISSKSGWRHIPVGLKIPFLEVSSNYVSANPQALVFNPVNQDDIYGTPR